MIYSDVTATVGRTPEARSTCSFPQSAPAERSQASAVPSGGFVSPMRTPLPVLRSSRERKGLRAVFHPAQRYITTSLFTL